MTTSRTITSRPAWVAREERDEGPTTHPDDAGAWIYSRPVDSWQEQGTSDAVSVYAGGFRHNKGSEHDWADSVHLEGQLHEGCRALQEYMSPATARRLAAALIAAADLIDAGGQK